jgi:dTDP-glucose 4,6-dehydratase
MPDQLLHFSRVSEEDLLHIAYIARADLESLAGARLFVTGGTGYIGRWLLEGLCHANRALSLDLGITVLSRNPAAFQQTAPHLAGDPAVTMVCGDILDFPFPKARFTHAIHAATDVIATNSPLKTFDVTVAGTRRFLDFCMSAGVRDALLLSSGAIYGVIPQTIECVPENYLGRPALDRVSSAYGVGKLATEWLGTAYSQAEGLQCKSARIFAQIGPYLALGKHFAAGNFIFNALRNEPFVIKGDGTPRRSYMYGTDLVIWLLAILLRGRSSAAYNVGSDVGLSILELAKHIAAAANLAAPTINVLGTPAADGSYERYVPDISLARQALGLDVTVPIDAALAKTLNWFRPILNQ